MYMTKRFNHRFLKKYINPNFSNGMINGIRENKARVSTFRKSLRDACVPYIDIDFILLSNKTLELIQNILNFLS